MTVQELRVYLDTLPDYDEYNNLELVVVSSDHCYRLVEVEIVDAEKNGKEYYEYFDKANMSKGGKKVEVLLFQ